MMAHLKPSATLEIYSHKYFIVDVVSMCQNDWLLVNHFIDGNKIIEYAFCNRLAGHILGHYILLRSVELNST